MDDDASKPAQCVNYDELGMAEHLTRRVFRKQG
jgi:hypothetical protein